MSNDKFLSMEGLGDEVPFFVHTYNIAEQVTMYRRVAVISPVV